MPKFFVTQKQINENNIKIIGQDVRHIKNVLRKAVGDEIIICDNTDEKDYLCRIDAIEKEIINCKNSQKNGEVHIFIFKRSSPDFFFSVFILLFFPSFS